MLILLISRVLSDISTFTLLDACVGGEHWTDIIVQVIPANIGLT